MELDDADKDYGVRFCVFWRRVHGGRDIEVRL